MGVPCVAGREATDSVSADLVQRSGVSKGAGEVRCGGQLWWMGVLARCH